jgi:hypothetical protein
MADGWLGQVRGPVTDVQSGACAHTQLSERLVREDHLTATKRYRRNGLDADDLAVFSTKHAAELADGHVERDLHDLSALPPAHDTYSDKARPSPESWALLTRARSAHQERSKTFAHAQEFGRLGHDLGRHICARGSRCVAVRACHFLIASHAFSHSPPSSGDPGK